MITRRRIIGSLVAMTLAAASIGASGQQSRRITRIAVLSAGADSARPIFTAFRRRLHELGYEEGNNLQVPFYLSSGAMPLAELAQMVVRDAPDVVVADGFLAAQSVASVTRTIPIVAVTGDPVARGLAASLARPGRNVTGVSTISEDLARKQLELLCQLVPSARHVAYLDAGMVAFLYREVEERARELGVSVRRIPIRSQADVEREVTPPMLRDVDGLVLPPSALFGSLSGLLTRSIAAAGKPAIYGDRDFVPAGGLVFYGIDIEQVFRRIAEIVDLVLKGANPAETPFEQPTRIELVINLRTARALRLSVPQALVQRADKIID